MYISCTFFVIMLKEVHEIIVSPAPYIAITDVSMSRYSSIEETSAEARENTS